MPASMYRATLFALYQFSLVLGIALLPVALVARRVGLSLPVGHLVEQLGDAYEQAAADPR